MLTFAGCFDRGGLDSIDDMTAAGGGSGAGKAGTAGAKGAGGGAPATGGVAGLAGASGAGGQPSAGGGKVGTGTGGTPTGTGGSGGVPGTGGKSGGGSGGVPGTGGKSGGGSGGSGGIPGTGGSPVVCPGVMCDLYCPNGFQTDASGCPICNCSPTVCQPNVCPFACPSGYEEDASGCELCKCSPETACTTADCGAPVPGTPNILCTDGSIAGPTCQRDTSGKCTWQLLTCPAGCSSNGDYATCVANSACTWLAPGCGQPTLAAAGCYAASGIGCTSDDSCGQGHQCLKRVINPCFNAACTVCAETQTVCQ
jgi:hypothetical protein